MSGGGSSGGDGLGNSGPTPLPMAVPVGLHMAPPPPLVDMEIDAPPASTSQEKEPEKEEEEKPKGPQVPAKALEVLAKLNALAPAGEGGGGGVTERMPMMGEEEREAVTTGRGLPSSDSPGAFAASLPTASAETLAAQIQERGGLPLLEQMGPVSVGPGAEKEAMLLGIGLPKLSSRQMEDLANAKRYAMDQSVKQVLLRQTAAHQANQQKVAMYAQALSLMARIYIGSISFEVREETIKQTFAPFGPVKSINMSWDPITGHHKGFAFLEYDVPEAALLAQEQMNGVLIGGRNVKVSAADEGVKLCYGQQVGRPANTPQATPLIDMIMTEAKEYHRIYVASIHHDLNEHEVKSVFEAFGKVKGCILAKAGPQSNAHRGYGYIEYEEPSAVSDAVASMNLFDLGGQHLRVGKAITPPQAQSYVVPTSAASLPTAAAVAAAAVTAKIQAMEATVGSNTIGAGGIGRAPQVVVGGTAEDIGGNPNQGALFTVPQPGLAKLSGVGTATPPTNGNGSSSPNVPPPGILEVNSLASTTNPIVATPVSDTSTVASSSGPIPADGTFTAPQGAAPAKSKSKKTKAIEAPKPKALMDNSGTALVLAEDPMAILFGLKKKQAADAKKAKKKPRPKKKGEKSEEEKQGEITGAKMNAQQMVTAETAQKILDSGALTDKQKQMLEVQAGSSLAAQEDLKIKGNEARNILMHKLMRKGQSRVVCLRNMVDASEVDEALEEDVKEECAKSGSVESVLIYQEKASEAEDAPIHVKIFVQFSLHTEAATAQAAMNGRFFGGRKVVADIYDQSLFDHNDLTQ